MAHFNLSPLLNAFSVTALSSFPTPLQWNTMVFLVVVFSSNRSLICWANSSSTKFHQGKILFVPIIPCKNVLEINVIYFRLKTKRQHVTVFSLNFRLSKIMFPLISLEEPCQRFSSKSPAVYTDESTVWPSLVWNIYSLFFSPLPFIFRLYYWKAITINLLSSVVQPK